MRKTIEVTIQDGEATHVFRIKQMSASKSQSWLIRAGLLLTKGNINLLDMDLNKVTGWIKQYGFSALQNLEYESIEPLLDDLIACCSKVDGKAETLCDREFLDSFIHDVTTLFVLQKEAFMANFGFFIEKLEGLSASLTMQDTDKKSAKASSSPDTPTSPTL